MIDTSAMMFPKPDVGMARRRKQRAKKADDARFREEVLALDGKCLDLNCECHKGNPILDAHHIDLKGRGVIDNSPENGGTLCRYGAHRRVHDGYTKDGVYISPDQAMLEILEQHLGATYWRWDDQYEKLQMKVNNS